MPLATCNQCGQQFYGVACPRCAYPPSPDDANPDKRSRLFGIITIAVAAFILIEYFMSHRPNSERWVLLPASGVFFLAGLSLLVAVKGKWADFLGALILSGLSTLGFYAAFGSGEIAGGIPFIPSAWNQGIGKIAFAFGACIVGAVAIWSFGRAIRPRRQGGGGANSDLPRTKVNSLDPTRVQ